MRRSLGITLAALALSGCAMPLSNDGDQVTIRHDPEVDMPRVIAMATEQCAQARRGPPTLKHTAILNTWLPAGMVPRMSTFSCGPPL